MGLGGRKTKQRIGADPRNLSWADNAARFGQEYLSKLGWNPSEGLGVRADGRVSHIKVAQKLDMLGIGAGGQRSSDLIAIRQNRDYEIVLERLNAATPDVGEIEPVNEPDASVAETDIGDASTRKSRKKREREEGERVGKKKKSRKDPSPEADDGASSSTGGKKRVKDPDTVRKTKRVKSSASASTDTVPDVVVKTPATSQQSRPPRPMAHRARFLASKRMAAMGPDSTIGILDAPTSAPTTSASTPYDTRPTSPVLAGHFGQGTFTQDSVKPEILSISSKSIGDYFQQKLAAKQKNGSNAKGPVTKPPFDDAENDDDQAPKVGLGASRRKMHDIMGT